MHLDLPSSSPKLSEPFARAQGSRTARVRTLPTTCTHAPTSLPLGPRWPLPQSQLLDGALRPGRTRLGQARSGRVLCSPWSGDALRQVPLSRQGCCFNCKVQTPHPALYKLLSSKPDSAARGLGCGAAGLRDEAWGGARCGKRGGAGAGATLGTAAQAASPLRPAGLSSSGDEAGSWTAYCNASWEMEFALGMPSRKEPRENYKSRSAARGSRAATPLGWAPALLAPPLAKLRWPPVEGRLQSEGRRWVRCGAAQPETRGAETAGEGTRAHLAPVLL